MSARPAACLVGVLFWQRSICFVQDAREGNSWREKSLHFFLSKYPPLARKLLYALPNEMGDAEARGPGRRAFAR